MSQFYLEAVQFDESNPEPRCACVLLLDVSGSMGGEPLNQLNQGLVAFQQALQQDELACLRVEVAVVTFGASVTLVQDFISAKQFQPPMLVASGDTRMGTAINQALDMVQQRKQIYKQNSVAYYRPWIFLITDGAPTDGTAWQMAAQRVKEEEAKKSVAFFTVGVQGADMKTLSQISSRSPLPLQGLHFRELFVWLSQSLTSVSHSQVGADVFLPPTSSWVKL